MVFSFNLLTVTVLGQEQTWTFGSLFAETPVNVSFPNKKITYYRPQEYWIIVTSGDFCFALRKKG